MAFSENIMCTSFKKQLLEGKHNFTQTTGHTFGIALYDNNASFTEATTNYTSTNEVAASGSYKNGGPSANVNELDSLGTSSGSTVAWADFNDITFTSATITAYGALIYNSTTDGGTDTTDAVAILDFEGAKTSTSGDFKISFPDPTGPTNAIIRIGSPA
jgi:hypothetical protein